MKLENFHEAKDLVEQINEISEIIKSLQRTTIKVKLNHGLDQSFLEVWHHHDTEVAKIAAGFVTDLLAHYESEKKELLSKLETL